MADDASSSFVSSATIEEAKTQLIFPQSQLISLKLTENNYLIWKTQVLTAIKGYGLDNYIDPEPQVPNKFVADGGHNQISNPLFILWSRQDHILASWILSSLSEGILPLIIGLSSSSEIWSTLEKNFANQSKAKTLQYKFQLQTTKKGNMCMRDYLAKIKMCCDMLATTGNIVSENDQIMHILSGLGPEYDAVVVTVTAGVGSFGLSDIHALLLSFEARLESVGGLSTGHLINTDGSQPSVNYAAQDSNTRRNFNNISYNGRGRGNYSFRGRGNRGGFRGRGRFQGSRITCQVCHLTGHTADRCWHRFDKSYGVQNNQQSNMTDNNNQNKNYSLNLAQLPGSSCSSDDGWWFPDSGASTHVTNELNNLQSASEYNGGSKLQLGNGQYEQIHHIGNTTLLSERSNRLFYLKELLHVPGITKNLMSVSKFALDNNVFFEFHPLFCLIKDQETQEVLLKGMLKEGLYRFSFDVHNLPLKNGVSFQNKLVVSTASVCNNLDICLWHKRLGHCSYDIVKRALRTCDISFNDKREIPNICAPCILAKSHKLPFGNSDSNSSCCFELIHSDLWGPAPIQSINGYRYYVTYIDDHSRFVWIYLLKQKSEVAGTFQHLYKLVETQYAARIKGLQSDGGMEYKVLNDFFEEKGIIHRISCPYTPQQNGAAERKHRHVVEVGLSLLAQSDMPMKYWDDSFATATHLINRIPAKRLGYISPYEKLTKKKPDYNSLKVFGCLAYPHVRPYNKHKLQYRASPGVFLGYSNQYKGYKILLPSGKVMITRDVVFEENVFPFSKNAKQGTETRDITQPIFITSEPTVASFPNYWKPVEQATESECNNPHNSPIAPQEDGLTEESDETIPLRVDLPQVSAGDSSNSPSHVTLEGTFAKTNKHPMITRAKAGIHKPKIWSAELADILEPKSVNEALMNPIWKQAMSEELDALQKNKTWTLTSLPEGANLVGNKWVFKVKKKADGSVERYKARLVAQGYSQLAGFDFHETFSLVIKPATIRVILSVALTHSWRIKQLDVSNAFLNGELSEVIYMNQPKGFEQGNNLVCKLNKAIYGLKQASRAWYIKVKQTLGELNFVNSKADCSLFLYNKGGVIMYILIYVDDILVTGNNNKAVEDLINQLKKHFSVKDLGDIHHFLGIQVTKTDEGIHLSQKEYIRRLLWKANMLHANKSPTPMITSPQLSKYVGSPIKDAAVYRSLVGALHYVTITRPEISFAVNKVSQYMSNPLEPHLKAVKRILRYLAGTDHYGLKLCKPKHLNITGFSDSDWAVDMDDRRSVSGYCVYVGGNLVSWSSKKQGCVSRSSTEAEYRSLAQVVSEITWLKYLMDELRVHQTRTPQIWIDNQSAIYLSSNPVLHARTKHIELDFHFIRDKVAEGLIQVNYVPSYEQIADILTKPLSLQFFSRLRKNLTVTPHPSFELRGAESQDDDV